MVLAAQDDAVRLYARGYYYDAKKYPSYLDQLGIKFPNPPTAPIRKITPPKTPGSDTNSGG